MSVQVIAYYTEGAYEREAQSLLASAVKVGGVRLRCDRLFDVNTWRDAVLYKPQFIADALLFYRDNPDCDGILYTDADSVFKKTPDFSSLKGLDFAAHWFTRSKAHGTEILTGTLYFGNTERARAMVREWVSVTPRYAKGFTPEQDSLKFVFNAWQRHVTWKDFGPEMVWIYDDFPKHYGKRDVVIEHYQASRRYRYLDKPPMVKK